MKKYFFGFLQYSGLLKELVKRDFKLKYRKSSLGFLWSLLNPLFIMLVMSVVFSSIFGRVGNYTVYLLTGKLLFDFYAEATKTGMNSIISNAGLINKVYVPKYIFTLSKVIMAFINMMLSMVILILMMIVTKSPITWTCLLAPLPVVYMFVFALGMSLILATLTVFFRDVLHLYSVLLLAWNYLTPIFYPADIILEHYRFIYSMNPLTAIVTCFRDSVMYGVITPVSVHIQCIAAALIVLASGLLLFYKHQRKFYIYM